MKSIYFSNLLMLFILARLSNSAHLNPQFQDQLIKSYKTQTPAAPQSNFYQQYQPIQATYQHQQQQHQAQATSAYQQQQQHQAQAQPQLIAPSPTAAIQTLNAQPSTVNQNAGRIQTLAAANRYQAASAFPHLQPLGLSQPAAPYQAGSAPRIQQLSLSQPSNAYQSLASLYQNPLSQKHLIPQTYNYQEYAAPLAASNPQNYLKLGLGKFNLEKTMPTDTSNQQQSTKSLRNQLMVNQQHDFFVPEAPLDNYKTKLKNLSNMFAGSTANNGLSILSAIDNIESLDKPKKINPSKVIDYKLIKSVLKEALRNKKKEDLEEEEDD